MLEAEMAAPGDAPACAVISAVADAPGLRLERDARVIDLWRRTGALCGEALAGGAVVSAPLALDAPWAAVAARIEAFAATDFRRSCNRRGGIVDVSRTYPARRDFGEVVSCWKRRDGVAAGLHDAYGDDARALWLRRVVALDAEERRLVYYADDNEASVRDWKTTRGDMQLSASTTLHWTKDGNVAVVGDDEPQYFRRDDAPAAAGNPVARGAPTAHVLEVAGGAGPAWTFCFDDAETLSKWRRALAACAVDGGGGAASYAVRVGAATSLAANRSRERWFVVECAGDVGPVVAAVARAAAEVEDEARLASAARLGRFDAAASGLRLVVDLDGGVVAELRRGGAAELPAALRAERNALERAVEARFAAVAATTALLRPAYDAARQPLPRRPVLQDDFLATLLRDAPQHHCSNVVDYDALRCASTSAADVRAAERASASASAPDDVKALLERCFNGPDERPTADACAAARAALLARAASHAARHADEALRDLAARRATWTTDTIIKPLDDAIAQATEALLSDLPGLVRAGAWIGSSGPSAELWSRFDDAAALRDAALVQSAAIHGRATPGTLFCSATAIYFAPAPALAALGGLGARFGLAKAAVSLRVPLRDVSAASRAQSPVPLKNNALLLETADGARHTFTLTAPGASVTLLLAVVETLRRLAENPAGRAEKPAAPTGLAEAAAGIAKAPAGLVKAPAAMPAPTGLAETPACLAEAPAGRAEGSAAEPVPAPALDGGDDDDDFQDCVAAS
ncbi:hypothetical protein M885DRAFT_610682 [Pelagophyceae sp. CCMP2097]|nr:hypothetical protein M885DRAFT_610682 [Pelagophyceae sp. CCMP2097]